MDLKYLFMWTDYNAKGMITEPLTGIMMALEGQGWLINCDAEQELCAGCFKTSMVLQSVSDVWKYLLFLNPHISYKDKTVNGLSCLKMYKSFT